MQQLRQVSKDEEETGTKKPAIYFSPCLSEGKMEVVEKKPFCQKKRKKEATIRQELQRIIALLLFCRTDLFCCRDYAKAMAFFVVVQKR